MWLILGLLFGLTFGLPILLWLSARASLDASLAHTRATDALPFFDDQTESGLVRIGVGDFAFRARVAGFGRAGPGLILLHGFPESSIMWQPLIDRAVGAGFRVVAFDQRGYSPGARPRGATSYDVSLLVRDLLGVADAVGFGRFHLVGHDWGSIVGWCAAAEAPERIVSWASLSIPHPGALPNPSAPKRRPIYISVFRMSGLAETLLGFGGRWPLRSLAYSKMPATQRAEYDALFAEPGALSAALNWYRALPEQGFSRGAESVVRQPVLYVYGRQDMQAFVGPSVQARLPAFVEGPFESLALDAGHWLIQEEESLVLDAVMRHLEAHRS